MPHPTSPVPLSQPAASTTTTTQARVDKAFLLLIGNAGWEIGKHCTFFCVLTVFLFDPVRVQSLIILGLHPIRDHKRPPGVAPCLPHSLNQSQSCPDVTFILCLTSASLDCRQLAVSQCLVLTWLNCNYTQNRRNFAEDDTPR